MTTGTEGSGAGSEPKKRYARRWVEYAFETAKDWFELHVPILVLTLVAPPLGYFAYAYVTANPNDFVLAVDGLRSILIGFAGTIALFALAFLIQLLRAPAALERAAAFETKTQIDALEQELSDANATIERQRVAMDSTTLHQIEVAHEGKGLLAVDVSDASKNAWLEAERRRYVDGYKSKNDADQRAKQPYGLTFADPLTRETRSGDRFVDELRTYFEAMNGRWIDALRAATIDRQITHLRLAVTNPRDVSVEGLEVQVTLPADVGAGWDEDAEFDEEMPDKPMMWGSHTIGAFLPSIRPVTLEYPGRIERVAGRLMVTWDRFNLSASARHPIAPLALFVPNEYAGGTLAVEWSASSLRLRSVQKGTLAVGVAAGMVAPGAVLSDPDDHFAES